MIDVRVALFWKSGSGFQKVCRERILFRRWITPPLLRASYYGWFGSFGALSRYCASNGRLAQTRRNLVVNASDFIDSPLRRCVMDLVPFG
jgi:hypothetical protein